MNDDDVLARSLAELGHPAPPRTLEARTLSRALAWLDPPAEPAWAVPALLVSAAAVFVADTCAMILRVFGG